MDNLNRNMMIQNAVDKDVMGHDMINQELETCACCGESEGNSKLVIDDTSIYEYDVDCLQRKNQQVTPSVINQKQKEL